MESASERELGWSVGCLQIPLQQIFMYIHLHRLLPFKTQQINNTKPYNDITVYVKNVTQCITKYWIAPQHGFQCKRLIIKFRFPNVAARHIAAILSIQYSLPWDCQYSLPWDCQYSLPWYCQYSLPLYCQYSLPWYCQYSLPWHCQYRWWRDVSVTWPTSCAKEASGLYFSVAS